MTPETLYALINDFVDDNWSIIIVPKKNELIFMVIHDEKGSHRISGTSLSDSIEYIHEKIYG